jgi:hypothetical protein
VWLFGALEKGRRCKSVAVPATVRNILSKSLLKKPLFAASPQKYEVKKPTEGS